MLNLQKIRLDKNLNISQLSRLSGVSRAYITQLDREIYQNPTIEVLVKLCKALDVSPNELIKEEYWKK